jgi:predicted negative regulator of RcsB-dependent stress response
MAEEYLTDDEQLEHVKRLAAEYGPWTIGAVVLGLAFVVGYRYYDHHRNERALAAAARFADMTTAVQRNDASKAQQIAAVLIKDYADTPYADQAQLTLARIFVDQKQDANAIAPLTQVMDHSKDGELRHIARLRLARVLIDQGKPDDAIQVLSDPAGAFGARYHDVRGDAYFAKKDLNHAAEEYKAALAEGSPGGMDSALLALKISDLGLSSAPTASGSIAPPVDSSNKATP